MMPWGDLMLALGGCAACSAIAVLVWTDESASAWRPTVAIGETILAIANAVYAVMILAASL